MSWGLLDVLRNMTRVPGDTDADDPRYTVPENMAFKKRDVLHTLHDIDTPLVTSVIRPSDQNAELVPKRVLREDLATTRTV